MTSQYPIPCKGVIAYSQHDWQLADLLTREPKDNEFLVEMIATGVCHTDISGYGGIYPRVLGHEGNIPPLLNFQNILANVFGRSWSHPKTRIPEPTT